MENLFEVLSDLTKWCSAQRGEVMWTLMQTFDNGRRGFQLFVVDHESPEGDIWHCNTVDLARVAELTRTWLNRSI
jgi:hypothetical protein